MNHIAMLYDKELKDKVKMLLNVGKEVDDISLNPNVLLKYNKEELKNVIDTIKNGGMDPKDIPLMAY